MIRKGLYKGFSSHEYPKTGSFKLTDIDLVKMDLLNHIFTRPGERVMMPTYGTSIPDLVFEPLSSDLGELVVEEIERVVDMDPRVRMNDIVVRPDYENNALFVGIELYFVELNMVDTLELNVGFGGD